MNNLSVLRESYNQIWYYFTMVEKNIICPTCRGENLVFDEAGISWEDLQGLTWLFCENCSNQTIDEIQKKIISYA